MADYYTSANLLKAKRKGRDGKVYTVWQGVLKYQAENPEYIEDTRKPEQRRKSFGTKPNPDYVEDTRTPTQRRRTITKQIRKVFDPEIAGNKSSAYTELVKWRAQMEKEHAAPDASMTVASYVKQYIETRARAGMEQSTAFAYTKTARYFERGGAHAIGGIPLRELTPRQVEAWETELLASGLSGTTVLRAHRLLKQVCKSAVDKDELSKSPVRGFKAPSRSTGRPNALDSEGHAKAMLVLGSMEDEPVVIAAELALYLGLRRGEICALTWGNVDLEGVAWQDADRKQWGAKKVRVMQSFGEAKGGGYLKTPKTSAGTRIVTLEGGIVDVLNRRRAAMWDEWSEAMRRANIVPTERAFNSLYVIGRCNGSNYPLNTLSREWAALARKYDLRGTEGRHVTMHDLRHSAATHAITRGVDVSSVAANLGHAQVSTTLNMYVSRDAEAQREANRIVAQALDAARQGEVLPFSPRPTGTDN